MQYDSIHRCGYQIITGQADTYVQDTNSQVNYTQFTYLTHVANLNTYALDKRCTN